MSQEPVYKKAFTLSEVDQAVRFDVPIGADHAFYTDFSDVRGDFEDRMIYKMLNVDPKTFVFNGKPGQSHKSLLFLAGMRGSGKTSELAKVSKKLHHKDCFFCVTCNLDDGLDLNDMEYMDILVFQLERLFEELKDANLPLEEDIIASLQKWFAERVAEVNKAIKKEGGFEVDLNTGIPGILGFLGLTTKVKSNLLGSKENAEKIRTVLKNNFSDFAKKVNEFIAYLNMILRNNGKAKEVLFVVDGIEKTATPAIREQIIFEESNRIRQVKTNTIFTLPIELMPETQRLLAFSTVVSFPFVKIREKDGSINEAAVSRFTEFTYKRIDESLFDSADTIREAILWGGGSPREYLRILQYANMHTLDGDTQITKEALEKGVKKLAAQTAQYLTEEDLKILKALKEANSANIPTPYGEQWQDLLEKLIVLEYNDGTYKRVNPIVEESPLYKHYVG
jgi:hypothetical protein